jgi:hypothetical protein
MHAAVFAAGGGAPARMRRPRAQVAHGHPGRGREVIGVDWPRAHPARAPPSVGVDQAAADVQKRPARCPTVVTAVLAQRHGRDGRGGVGQAPTARTEAMACGEAPSNASSAEREAARKSVLARLPHRRHRVEARQRPAPAREIVPPLAAEGPVPPAHAACATGGLTLALTRSRASRPTQWVSAWEGARPRPWYGPWRRADVVAAELQQDHPDSCRPVTVPYRHGAQTPLWAVPKAVRLQRDGRKRSVSAHEKAAWTELPRCLVTEAWPWGQGRGRETWSDRWAAAICHACGTQVTGWEAAQVRQEDAGTRHFRWSGVAQSMRQRAPACASTSARSAFAEGQIPDGQPGRAIGREVMRSWLELIKQRFAAGTACADGLEVVMPA